MIKKCQVFTPAQNVNELLDSVGYSSNLSGKKVIENACGDGSILTEIVRRYIIDALTQNKNIDEIRQGLQSDVYGTEIDELHYKNCIKNLSYVAESFNIPEVKWNIFNGDFLKQNYVNMFDFVIGNPPYITYRDLDDETRNFLRDNYASCRHGKFDYCYAFIEASIICLKQTGKMAYLIPSSIFKNVFAQELREIILPSTVKVIDYTTHKLFDKKLTSSAILVCHCGEAILNIVYKDVANNRECQISKNSLEGKWVFSNFTQNSKSNKRFGDYFTAAISIATLFNEAYILKDFTEENDYIVVDEYKIEKELIRIGASPRSLNYNKDERILFPYKYVNNKLIRYTQKEFEERFPEATRYLRSYAKKLSARKSDNGCEWFEYGRSQALAHLNQPKLLLSTVVTKEVKVYELAKECIPYSGIYIVPKGNISLNKAKEVLESDDFYLYVKGIGINASGSSLRITAVDINDYVLNVL
ncbi:MAG: N-6 DNA methylase [Sedimentibacter saalensis]|uniref:Eco57I restriction-modification methylase domain-containing protein n=1 Tax=Sedimentibacter saalensis TaxID=130788 RepID=UPI002B21B6CF|nr:N-6 DNA methylase [Sedimentibacter saalensis]MEA5094963.1 N-6 DNA methylase [Sedimentibacter saalensis]